jgi:hypothetical protein
MVGGVVDMGLVYPVHRLRDAAVEGVVGVAGLGRGGGSGATSRGAATRLVHFFKGGSSGKMRLGMSQT